MSINVISLASKVKHCLRVGVCVSTHVEVVRSYLNFLVETVFFQSN